MKTNNNKFFDKKILADSEYFMKFHESFIKSFPEISISENHLIRVLNIAYKDFSGTEKQFLKNLSTFLPMVQSYKKINEDFLPFAKKFLEGIDWINQLYPTSCHHIEPKIEEIIELNKQYHPEDEIWNAAVYEFVESQINTKVTKDIIVKTIESLICSYRLSEILDLKTSTFCDLCDLQMMPELS
ncbi:MAG: hypothetical protein RSB76_02485 [Clostridia bacterium]